MAAKKESICQESQINNAGQAHSKIIRERAERSEYVLGNRDGGEALCVDAGASEHGFEGRLRKAQGLGRGVVWCATCPRRYGYAGDWSTDLWEQCRHAALKEGIFMPKSQAVLPATFLAGICFHLEAVTEESLCELHKSNHQARQVNQGEPKHSHLK